MKGDFRPLHSVAWQTLKTAFAIALEPYFFGKGYIYQICIYKMPAHTMKLGLFPECSVSVVQGVCAVGTQWQALL